MISIDCERDNAVRSRSILMEEAESLSSLSCLTFQNVRQSVQYSLYQGETTMSHRHQCGWLKKEQRAQGETWVFVTATSS